MTRKIIYTICRPVIRKCPKCYCVLIPFVLALFYTAYVYRAQDFGDADDIRIPDNVVDVKSAAPRNGINSDRKPVIEKVLSAAEIKETLEENMRLVRNIVSPIGLNAENPRDDTSMSATPNNKNESKAIGENLAPRLNSSNVAVPIDGGHPSDNNNETLAKPSEHGKDPAPGNVATPNQVNANRSSTTVTRENINVPQTNSTHLNKKAESSNLDVSHDSKTINSNDARSPLAA